LAKTYKKFTFSRTLFQDFKRVLIKVVPDKENCSELVNEQERIIKVIFNLIKKNLVKNKLVVCVLALVRTDPCGYDPHE
jgi:hypothetical protein